MREMKIFCSARDQEARVVLADEPIDDAHAELADLTLSCREIGVKCSGSMCPVCAEPAPNVGASGSGTG
jgi:hypothetical protein